MLKNKRSLFLLKTVFWLMFFMLQGRAMAQQVIWAQCNNLDKRTDFTKVVGQNKHGVFVLKHRNNTFRKYFIIEKFDKRMNLLRSKTIKIPNAELQKIVVLEDEVIFFTKIFDKGYTYTLTMQHLDTSLNVDLPVIIATGCDLVNSYSDFKIEYSENRKKMLAWYIGENENNSQIHLIPISDGKIRSPQIIDIPQAIGNIDILKAIIDFSGNFYCLMTFSKNQKSSKAIDFRTQLLCANLQKNEHQISCFHAEDDFISYADLVINSSTNKVHATGLYGKKDDDDDRGYFDVCINPSDFKIDYRVFNEINRKTVADIIGIKAEQRSENLNKFKIRKTIPKTDGGCVVIAERSFITNQSDVFYVNGVPQTSYSKIFNNDEILLLALDSNGNLLWDEIVFKNQTSTNDGGYNNGIVIMVNEDNFNIIYNDKLNANADVIQISFNEKGERIKKILLNSDQYYALVIPSEYNQVTSNSVVLTVNQNRDYTYIKLLY